MLKKIFLLAFIVAVGANGAFASKMSALHKLPADSLGVYNLGASARVLTVFTERSNIGQFGIPEPTWYAKVQVTKTNCTDPVSIQQAVVQQVTNHGGKSHYNVYLNVVGVVTKRSEQIRCIKAGTATYDVRLISTMEKITPADISVISTIQTIKNLEAN